MLEIDVASPSKFCAVPVLYVIDYIYQQLKNCANLLVAIEIFYIYLFIHFETF